MQWGGGGCIELQEKKLFCAIRINFWDQRVQRTGYSGETFFYANEIISVLFNPKKQGHIFLH